MEMFFLQHFFLLYELKFKLNLSSSQPSSQNFFRDFI